MAKKHNWQRRGKSATLHVCITELGVTQRFTRTVPYTTDAKVDREWEKFYQECAAGKIGKPNKITVSQMTDLVMRESVIPNCKRSTAKGYRSAQKKIKDTWIGDKIAADLKPIHIQKWVNELAQELDPKTVRNYYSFLRRCFATMESWEQIPKTPCRHIKQPKLIDKEIQIIHQDDIYKFLEALESIPREKYDYKVAILLALFGGLRRGELCGIEKDDVDFDSGAIAISKTLNVDRGVYEDTPKSKQSVRVVYYPKEIMSEIRKLNLIHKEMQLMLGTKWKGSTRLLNGTFGSDMHPDNIWHFLDKFLKQHGLQHVSLHGLRHTFTSMLVDMDKPLAQVSKTLGHAQQSTTLNIYSHLFKDPDTAKKEAANEMSELFLQQNYNKG